MDLPRYGFCPTTSLKRWTQLRTICSISFKGELRGILNMRISCICVICTYVHIKFGNVHYINYIMHYDEYHFIQSSKLPKKYRGCSLITLLVVCLGITCNGLLRICHPDKSHLYWWIYWSYYAPTIGKYHQWT